MTLAAAMISAVGAVSAAATEPAGTRVTLAVTLPSGATVPGAGEIVANDHDRRCPPGCAYAVPNGVPVVFHASGLRGYAFDHWTDASPCSGRDPARADCEVTPDGTPIHLTATVHARTFTLQVFPAGSGRITSRGGYGIDCGAGSEARPADVCSADFYPGATVTLTVIPALGSRFVGWGTSRCPAHTPRCRVRMNSDRSVTALLDPVHLTVRRVGVGGRIVSSPRGIDCRSDCAQQTVAFPRGARITLDAGEDSTPFRRWGGDLCSGPLQTCSVTLEEDEVVEAAFGNFAPSRAGSNVVGPRRSDADERFKLLTYGPGRLYATGPDGTPDHLRCRSRCEDWYPRHTMVTVRRVNEPHAHLVSWDCKRTKTTCKVDLVAVDEISAHFARNHK